MSKALLLEPLEDLITAVADELGSGGTDYSNCAVVFPGKRPAHFLRRELARRSGRSLIPPRIFSIDEFVDHVFRECLGVRKKDLDALDAVAILHELHCQSEERIGGNNFDQLDAFVSLGLRIFAELEELQIAGVPGRKVESGITPLRKFYRQLYLQAEEKGCTTRSLKYRRVAESDVAAEMRSLRKIVLAGFYALTRSEKLLFSKLLQLENAVVIFQNGRGLEKHLRELELHDLAERARATTTDDSAARQLQIHYYKSPDTHGQVFGLTRKIKELLDTGQVSDERTVIVLPASDVLFPVIQHTLSLIPEKSYNVSLGYPLTRTPVYGFLNSLMDLVAHMVNGKVYAPEYIRFVLHPYTKNILLENRADVTRVLFHTIEERIIQEKSLTFFTIESLEGDETLFEEASARAAAVAEGVTAEALRNHLRLIHDRTIRTLLGIRDVGDLSRRCIDILLFLDEYSTAGLHPFFGRYLETLIKALDRLGNTLVHESVFSRQGDYFGFLRHSLKAEEVHFPGAPLSGLQVLGFLETRNLQFDRVFVLDVNDDVIPGGAARATLVPRSVRESLGLPTQRDRDEIAGYYFDLLLRGAKEVHLFYVENDRKIRSRYVEQALWERQKEEGSGDIESLVKPIQYDVVLANNPPSPVMKTHGMVTDLGRFKYTATALDTYLHCPLKFYYACVLGLEEKEEVSEEIDRADLGSFIHRVLSTMFSGTIGKTLTRQMLEPARVETLVQQLFDESFGPEFHGGTYLMKNQVAKQLARFVNEYQLPVIDAHRVKVVSLEERLESRSRGYLFKGFLDRVEERDGKTIILDYKTGFNDRSVRIHFGQLSLDDRATWSKAIGSLQLPFYCLLYSTRYKKDVESILPAYIFLGKNQVDEEIEVRLFEEGDPPKERYALLESLIFRLIDEIRDVAKPFAPTDDLRANCPSCAFRSLCGTQWVRGRTYA